MSEVVTVPLLLACVVGAGWSGWAAYRGTTVSNQLLIALLVLEVLVVVQLVVAIGFTAAGTRPESTVTFLLYAGLAPFAVPAGVFWAAADRSRSAILVIAVTCIAVAVMTLRMFFMWSDAHG